MPPTINTLPNEVHAIIFALADLSECSDTTLSSLSQACRTLRSAYLSYLNHFLASLSPFQRETLLASTAYEFGLPLDPLAPPLLVRAIRNKDKLHTLARVFRARDMLYRKTKRMWDFQRASAKQREPGFAECFICSDALDDNFHPTSNDWTCECRNCDHPDKIAKLPPLEPLSLEEVLIALYTYVANGLDEVVCRQTVLRYRHCFRIERAGAFDLKTYIFEVLFFTINACEDYSGFSLIHSLNNSLEHPKICEHGDPLLNLVEDSISRLMDGARYWRRVVDIVGSEMMRDEGILEKWEHTAFRLNSWEDDGRESRKVLEDWMDIWLRPDLQSSRHITYRWHDSYGRGVGVFICWVNNGMPADSELNGNNLHLGMSRF